jgi:hypothetical protein
MVEGSLAVQMEDRRMKSLGTWLLVFGVGSMLLSLIGYEFRILSWIDTWGPTAGWSIRIGLTAVGGVLLLVGARSRQGAPAGGA